MEDFCPTINYFLVFIRNRLISGGLEPVLIHTKKIMGEGTFINTPKKIVPDKKNRHP